MAWEKWLLVLIERLSVVFLRPLRVLSRTLRGASYKPDHHSVGEPLGGFFPHLSLSLFSSPAAVFVSLSLLVWRDIPSTAARLRRMGKEKVNR